MPILSDSSAARLISASDAQRRDLARDLGDLDRPAQLLDIAAADEEIAEEGHRPVDDEANFLEGHADRLDRTRLDRA